MGDRQQHDRQRGVPRIRARRRVRWAAGVGGVLALALGLTAAPSAAAADTYSYPVLPGTARWAKFTTYQQMLDATQLPAATARRLSTAALVRATVEYPLFSTVLAFDNAQHGFARLAQRFRGAQELLRRPDAGAVLLHRYDEATARAATRGLAAPSAAAADRTRVELWQLETLLGQPEVLGALRPEQLDRAMALGERAYARKDAERSLYGLGGLESTATTMGRALALREGWDWRAAALLRGEPQASTASVAEVRAAVAGHRAGRPRSRALADPPRDGDAPPPPADRPVEPGTATGRPTEPGQPTVRPTEPGGGGRPDDNGNDGGGDNGNGNNDGGGNDSGGDGDGDEGSDGGVPGGDHGDEAITIRTPRGTEVPAQRQGSEMTDSEMRVVEREVARIFPQAVQESSPTRRYNCHSFAWYSQSPANDVWLDSPGDDAFWLDGSYRQWQSNQPFRSGMRVSWAYDDHSGIEVGRTGEIRSKWGRMPVIRAAAEYDPYDDTVLNRYVRR
ncbi:hypothetical protein GCM10010124_15340 [Pilimelia terevasa]|uniref:Uncharacterized protein n=1 Tax=Pilimelia terevasa TaxID=53372 RepID=A0A8J3FGW9_9ACTN|nr:hypothetical protein [Pilimelia terevasa]GGK23789.1 hypothetical protein GCM10010124_15340 [Pilimelia terevasa]